MKIVCVGMNYGNHIAEMGNEKTESPVFFVKPDNALLKDNDPFYIPDFSNDVQFECEFIVKICKVAKSVNEKFAHRYYQEVGLGIDFTARDLQRLCREKGLPWEISKGFDYSAAVTPFFVDKNKIGNLERVEFTLDVNGEQRQVGRLEDMIFSVDQIIAYVSKFMTLKVGDIIYTGTPAGVGKIKAGDRIVANLIANGLSREMLNFEVK